MAHTLNHIDTNTTDKDLKQTIKRTNQVILIALFILLVNGIIKYVGGLTISVYLMVAEFVLFSCFLITNRLGLVRLTRVGIILSISFLLVALAHVEGLRASAHLYFLALIFAIPAFVENSRFYGKEVFAYYIFIISCFCYCISFCPETSNLQHISVSLYHLLWAINEPCTVVLCAAFAFLNIYNERKYTEALQQEKRKAEEAGLARTRFLSNMGHELRTPLNGIVGATNILKKQETLPEQAEYLGILKYCSDHMLELVNDILDFNKIEAGKLDLYPVDLNLRKLLEQCVMAFSNRFEEKQLELRLDIDPALNCNVFADDTRLTQVLNNLISNAWKFTHEGSVELSAKIVGETDQQLTLRFAVKDTGIGIKQELISKIFESFWQVYHESTRQYSGTGLGLAISQKILKMMGTALEVESMIDQGTTFYFTATFDKSFAESNKSIHHTEITDLGGIKVLLAEDNAINMLIAKKTMQDWNVQLTTCINGLEAVKALEQSNDYDLILLDLEMPVMDGYTAMREIIKNHPDIPILAFTAALLDGEMYQSLLRQGFSDCILKPFQPMDLFHR